MAKKRWMKMLALVMSLTFCIVGAGCFGESNTSTSSDSEVSVSVGDSSTPEKNSSSETGDSSTPEENSSSKEDGTSIEENSSSEEDGSSIEENSSSEVESSSNEESSSSEEDSSSSEGEQVHTHSLTKVEAKAANCTEDGYTEYYACNGCEKVFADEAGTVETSLEEVKIAAGHTYVAVAEEEATYFEEGVKAHYTCENCEDKFLKEGENYTVTTDASLVLAKKKIADETTASSMDTTSSDLINTVVAEKVKQFDQTEPTYVKLANAEGNDVQAIYFSKTTSWDAALDSENNSGFSEFRIPVNGATGGVSFAYKMLDSNNDICETVAESDKAYEMKSYIEYKMNGEYVNVSKDIFGSICFTADGEWQEFSLECNQRDVEYILFKIYHFEGELVVTNMQLLEAKHIHATVEVPEQAETCTENGNTKYYTCDCGKFYADAEATQEIAENSWVLPAHHVLSDTLEYNETHHYYACTKCDYKEETAHDMSEWSAEHIGEKTRSCACNYVEKASQSAEEIDFTKNTYGASIYSFEWQAEYPDRIKETTASSLKYLLYHDNGVIKATHKVLLPRIDFTKYGQVAMEVLFDTFLWDQQFGLTEGALTNVSDTWVDATSYNGKLTFTWVNNALVMELSICGKTLTQTVTDENVINGEASAYFCAQAYYERYVTLSNFAFIAPEDVNPYGDQYSAGYATVSNETYDNDKRLASLTVDIPDCGDWSKNPPLLRESYLNQLYAEGVRRVVIEAASTTTTNNFITYYGTALDYSSADGFVVTIVENGGDLKFSYVNLGGGGVTVATTLTLSISYQLDPQLIANEIGMTLGDGVSIAKDAENTYTLSNVNSMNSAYFSAEQVNAWIAEGYTSISMKVTFTAGDTIDQTVCMSGVDFSALKGLWDDKTGSAEWTITLTADTPISLWAQKGGGASTGAFTVSQITLNKNA